MQLRQQTAKHPFGTIKSWMGATHFLCRTLPKVSVMRTMGTGALIEALGT